jgi:shikimate kinase
MSQPIYIVAGVPGSGKSWVCEQLTQDFQYLRHDGWAQRKTVTNNTYLENYSKELVAASLISKKPVLGDCPFAERLLKENLLFHGGHPTFLFLTVEPDQLIERYVERMKPLPKGHLTRARSMNHRAKEWKSFYGSSDDVLTKLKFLRQNPLK